MVRIRITLLLQVDDLVIHKSPGVLILASGKISVLPERVDEVSGAAIKVALVTPTGEEVG